MDSTTTASSIAQHIGDLGMSYYFDKGTSAAGKEIGLDVVSFYFIGRGGVLGDVPANEVDDTFYFFKKGAVEGMYSHARSLIDAATGAAAHLDAANEFARRTFGAVPGSVVAEFTEAAALVVGAAPAGNWPIFDGYRGYERPSDALADAYRQCILLRELRGGVHTDAVKASGLSVAESCYLDHDGAYFALHGFSDDDKPEVTDELRQRRLDAEADTTRRMAELLGVLSDAQRDALVAGASALHAALASPVAQ